MTPRRYAGLAAALTLPAVVVATQLYFGYRMRGVPFPFMGALSIQLCHWELWAIAGPVVWSFERRWPLLPARRRQALVRHAAAAAVTATVVIGCYLALYHALIRVPVLAPWFVGLDRGFGSTATFFFITDFHIQLLLYASVVAVAHAVNATALLQAREHDALRLEAELTGARLTALRTQLQPHFLFNTLHTIGSLVLQRQNERAVGILAELGDLLRITLAQRETDLTPLREEIAYVRRYLKIEEARFGDRLTLEWSVQPAAEDALIPPFILQPLVENAFRHGISHRTETSRLRISAASQNGSVRIMVYNDGPLLPEAFALDSSRGFGLTNVTERLRTRKPAGDLTLTNDVAGVCATIVLPRWEAAETRSAG